MEHANEVNIHTWRLDIDEDHLPEEVFLPTVTEEDAGKVLMAFSDGVWRMKKFSGVTPTLPYVEETYDSNGNLIDAKLVGRIFIRASEFNNCDMLKTISIPSGVTNIGEFAFMGCTSLSITSLPSGLTKIGDRAFSMCTNLALTSLPSELINIDWAAFYGCEKLALTSLPSGITSIEENTFYNCKRLSLASLPSRITSIGANAFFNCTNLTSITFEGTPTTIANNAFNGCTNLTTINVPWAEGEVSGAPWGATNATINYNYIP